MLRDWFWLIGGAGSAKKLRIAGCGLRVAGCGLRGFRKVPLRIPFRLPLRFPEGSAKVPRKLREGSARFRNGFLKDFPCWEGSARFRKGSVKVAKVPRRFRESCGKVPQGSAKVPRNFLRLSLASKVPQGSAKVPRKLREGSARFREGSAKFLKAFPCFQGSARFREGSAKVAGRFRKVPRVAGCEVPQGSAKVPRNFLRFS